MSETFYLRSKHQNFNTYTDVVDFEVVYPGGFRLDYIILGILVCLLFVLVPIIFLVNDLDTWFNYEAKLQETSAYVTSCTSSYSERRKEYHHLLEYYFDLSESRRYTDQGAVTNPRNLCDEFENGRPLPIQYVPDYPGESRIYVVFEPESPGYILFCTPVYIILVLFIVELKNYIQAQIKWRRLVREGHIFPGEVISNPNKKKNNPFRSSNDSEIHYTFITALGDRLVGKAYIPPERREIAITPYTMNGQIIERANILVRPRSTSLPPPGTPVAILYAGGDCHVML